MIEHPLTKVVRLVGIAALFVAGSTLGAAAFTETNIQPPASQAAPEKAAPNLNLEQSGDGVGLNLSTPDNNGTGETELNIPGVGTIGKLPKLDFGLELLYGNGGDENPNPDNNNRQDDVLIQGKIRHRF
jgi:hypothetical protein